MKTLYFDCFAGAAGDMILGALIDAGVPFNHVRAALGSLAVEGVAVSTERVLKAGVSSLAFRVTGSPTSAHAHHHLNAIFAAIERSSLSAAGKARATRMFTRLAEAEAAIHGTTMEKVHLHEVGAPDSIIDIVGTVAAMEWINAGQVVVSPVNVGGGMVHTAHGVFPVPAPATVRLLGNLPVYSSGAQMETLTPTGALILSEFATATGVLPAMRVTAVGYGAGTRDLPETPNVVRLIVGEADDSSSLPQVVMLACEIDDMNPQIFGALMDRLYDAGALEVFYQPVQMKKSRPGTLLTVIGPPSRQQDLAGLIFRETTTIGLRVQPVSRLVLERTTEDVTTPFGVVRFKVARQGQTVINAQPEFDDLVRAAGAHDVPIKMVQAAAQKAWLDRR
ncbi:MAG: nickel pincer cofactor biosynthesis protein LarC [Acidobacteria bacterium]|nr:nickel pincer cofactor biosynthesis protein LarC [Acidobacteriota bacterium]